MIVLFTGMSGIDIYASLSNFITDYKPFRTSLFEERTPEIIKIDTEIEKAYYSKNPHVEEAKNVWVEIILNQSYTVLDSLWSLAFDNALKRAIELENKQIPVFINLHSCYFHNKTKEYISLLDIDKLRDLRVTKVITFIDDVYDVYQRLTKPGGIYHGTEPSMVETIQRYFTLLNWRSKETMMSKFLAKHLRCKNFVFAVKHSYDTLYNLIFEDFPTTYLSHPISEVRRLEKSATPDEAEKIKVEITKISDYLTANFTAFLPTTIDEYRVKSESTIVMDNGYQEEVKTYFPVLTKRWEEELYKDPKGILYKFSGFNDLNELWHRHKPEGLNTEINQLLSVFVDTIGEQVSTRDYTLVEQSELIIIYRPLFNGNGSKGVLEEFNYFAMLSRDSNYQSFCFIYCPESDIKKYYENVFNEKIREYLRKKFLKKKDAAGSQQFYGLSLLECEKLTKKVPNNSVIFDLFNEVLENHNIVINVKNPTTPLGGDEIRRFKNKFVSKVLDDYSLIDEYHTGQTIFISQEMTIEQFCGKIKENLKDINLRNVNSKKVNQKSIDLNNNNSIEDEQSDIN